MMAADSKTRPARSKFALYSGKNVKDGPSTTRYHAVTQRRPWSPGVRRTPLMALAAVVLTILAIVTCIGILVGSNGKPVNSWAFQPTVYLAIATTISNICLHFAFAEGITNMWWTQALRGTTVGDLHRIHEFGNNFWAAIFAFPYINFIAIACLIVTISPINGPLMQRASQISTSGTQSTTSNLALPISMKIPASFTGYLSSRLETMAMLQKPFLPVVAAWNTQSPIHLENACSGTCNGRISGAGFSVNCTRSTLSFSLVPDGPPDTWGQQHPGSQYFGIGLNSSTYGFPDNSGTFSVVFKNTTACQGELQIQNCTLQPAKVSYPVTINGGPQTISLQQDSTIWDDEIISVVPSRQVQAARSAYGGIYSALSNRYTSEVTVGWDAVVLTEFDSTGFIADSYAVVPPYNGYINCTLSYANPMPDLLQSARDLMFRTAIAAAGYDSPSDKSGVLNTELSTPNATALKAAMQTITVTQSSSEARYKSDYAWLAGALIVTLIPTFLVTGLFWGYWKLGRRVSMSPIETAKALGSPLLIIPDGNATGKEIARGLNRLPVKYGGVATDAFVQTPTVSGGSGSQLSGERRLPQDVKVDEEKDESSRLRLLMRSPEMVLAPLKGWIFSG